MGLPAMKIEQTLISQGRHGEDKLSNCKKGYKTGKNLTAHFLWTIPNYATVAVHLTVYSNVIVEVL